MKRLLITILIITTAIALAACSHQGPAEDIAITDTLPAEDSTTTDTQLTESTDSTAQEQPAADASESETKATDPPQPQTNNVPTSSSPLDEQIKTELANLTQAEKDFFLYAFNISADEADALLINMTEEDKQFFLAETIPVIKLNTEYYLYDNMPQDPAPATPEPVPDTTPVVTRTDAEVEQLVNYYLDNYEDLVDFSDYSEEAMDELEENIEIVRNDPPGVIADALVEYKLGNISTDRLLYEIEVWIRTGGYGSNNIYIN